MNFTNYREWHAYTHVSYETPEPNVRIAFQEGAIGLDFNYQFIILVHIDKAGNF